MKPKKHDHIDKLSIDDQIAQTRYAGSLVTVLDEVLDCWNGGTIKMLGFVFESKS